ncbi:MAG: DnaJ domain-containing protein [Chromatiales bacterium]|jgi:curved DNA-binding protein CbpA
MQDPYLILSVPRDATDEQIHQAYLKAVRDCPADRDPQAFQAIRSAYETIRTQKLRLEYALFNTELPTPEDLLQRLGRDRQPRRPDLELFRELLRSGNRQVKQ